MTGRRGATLIEMTIVVAGSATVLLVLAGLMDGLLRARDATLASRRLHAMSARLADDLRRDVHAADRAELPPDTAHTLRLPQPDGSVVEYRVEPRRVVRRRTSDGQTPAHEFYLLEDEQQVRWLVEDSKPPQAGAEIHYRRSPRGPPRTLRITAVLGRDQRLSRRPTP